MVVNNTVSNTEIQLPVTFKYIIYADKFGVLLLATISCSQLIKHLNAVAQNDI